MGLTIAEGQIGVALLAGVLVGNVVEAYGAAQPIVAGGRSARFAVGLLAGIGLALAGATIVGATLLAGADPAVIGTAQAVAAGAVLAVVSIAVIPHAFEEVSSLVATVTALGFIAGYLLELTGARGSGSGVSRASISSRRGSRNGGRMIFVPSSSMGRRR